jgi:phosphatidate phosphatase APP1
LDLLAPPPEESTETRSLRVWQRFNAALVRLLARLALLVTRSLWAYRRRFGRLGPVQLVAYRGFGTAGRAVVRGRVLEASVLERSLPEDTRLQSFRRMLRRFNSREVPDAEVRVVFDGARVTACTDDEGYFELEFQPSSSVASNGGWFAVDVELMSVPVPGLGEVQMRTEVLVPGRAEFGIISDIDDTVLQTHVSQKLKMLWVTLLGSPYTRMPFEGTTELYRALCRGADGRGNNPVFYVSKSPWNLYDYLVDFMDHHELPRGPLLLRDIGLHEAPPLDHKTAVVYSLFDTYPHLSFVLLGDSGERDPDIYLAAASRYPGRVRAIYIRNVGGKRNGPHRVRTLEHRARELGTELYWMTSAETALAHAHQRGLVEAGPVTVL